MNALDRLRGLMSADRQAAERLLLGVLTLLVSVALGTAAVRQRAPTSRRIREYENALGGVAQFRAAYRPIPLEEEKRWQAEADSLVPSLPPGGRLAVVDTVMRVAESHGLRDVRVRLATPDSAFVPTRGGAAPAGYGVTIDGGGTYADLLRAIAALPAFVSVVRIIMVADPHGVRYHVVLAVYESSDGRRPA